jgi:hypothetical protein
MPENADMLTSHAAHDALTQMLEDIAMSTARLRVMVDDAHALVERLEQRGTSLRAPASNSEPAQKER